MYGKCVWLSYKMHGLKIEMEQNRPIESYKKHSQNLQRITESNKDLLSVTKSIQFFLARIH